jgi:hypothetical protein
VPDYDIEAAKRRQRERNKQAHEMTVEQLSTELDKLQNLSQAQIAEFGGSTEDMSDIIAEVQKATENNLSQAQLIGNIKSLGASATNLAKKVMSFM